jgi:hypothetical protein
MEVAVRLTVIKAGAAGATNVAPVAEEPLSVPQVDPEHADPLRLQLTPSPVGSLLTPAVNAAVAPALTTELAGPLIVTVTGKTVRTTEPLIFGSVVDVAVIVTFWVLPDIATGATYVTLVPVGLVSAPHTVPEQPVPLILQVTPTGLAAATIKKVDPVPTIVLPGAMVTNASTRDLLLHPAASVSPSDNGIIAHTMKSRHIPLEIFVFIIVVSTICNLHIDQVATYQLTSTANSASRGLAAEV